jgi:hypothetical protein
VHDGETFAHNAASRVLRSDDPASMRSLTRMMGLKVHWDAYRELDTGLRTGRRANPRIDYIGGDFFKDPIPPCDAYMMMTVLHDWSDAESVAILKNIKAAAPNNAKLLILEGVVQPDARDNFLLDLDIEMLVMTTGRERTLKEWNAVIAGAALSPLRVIAAGPWSSIIEVHLS